MKVELRESAQRHGVAMVMHTNDRGLLDVERFDLDPGRTLFHGLVDDLDLTPLRDLAAEQKTGLLLQIIDARMVSVRGPLRCSNWVGPSANGRRSAANPSSARRWSPRWCAASAWDCPCRPDGCAPIPTSCWTP